MCFHIHYGNTYNNLENLPEEFDVYKIVNKDGCSLIASYHGSKMDYNNPGIYHGYVGNHEFKGRKVRKSDYFRMSVTPPRLFRRNATAGLYVYLKKPNTNTKSYVNSTKRVIKFKARREDLLAVAHNNDTALFSKLELTPEFHRQFVRNGKRRGILT